MNSKKLKHLYLNKYLVTPLKKKTYQISFCCKHQILWYRNPKVATRTIDLILRRTEGGDSYIYTSEIAYIPALYEEFFKFAFVRDPAERFISAWKEKVLKQNYFCFSRGNYQRMKKLSNFIDWVEALDKEKCDKHLRAQSALIDVNNADYIGRMEKFEHDISYVAECTGIENIKIPHRNVTPKKKFDIPESQREKILDMYAKDVHIFYPQDIIL